MEERGWGIQCQSKLQWIVRKKKNLKRWLRPQSFVLHCFLFQLSLMPRQLLLAWLPWIAIWYLFIRIPFLKIWLCIHCYFEDFTHDPPTRQMQKGECQNSFIAHWEVRWNKVRQRIPPLLCTKNCSDYDLEDQPMTEKHRENSRFSRYDHNFIDRRMPVKSQS